MPQLNFGQPQSGVFQMAYVVQDIDASMRWWVEYLKVGPWFALESFTGEGPTYRGEPSEAEIARHAADGHELAFECAVPTGGRVGYVDTTAKLPGYLEVIEMDEPTEATFTRFYATSLAWDGSDPVRPFA